MLKLSLIAFLALITYYFNLYQSIILFEKSTPFTVSVDDIVRHTPNMIDYNPDFPSDDLPSNDHISIMVTEYYRDLNTYIMPTEKIFPLEVFHDHDGVSFSKTLYECIEYYNDHNPEIMKNTKHMKIIVVNTNQKSYCIMNTDLII